MLQFLIIQPAFIGDVVLATSLAEKIHAYYPDAAIDFLVRKGNESLLKDHPFLRNIWVWDKKNKKLKNLFQLAIKIRRQKYQHVVNPHRFSTSGFLTFFSGAQNKYGFDKNPWHWCYTTKRKHIIGTNATNYQHEVSRNQSLICDITDNNYSLPKLYPTSYDFSQVKQYTSQPYITISPSSVWMTKQFPIEKWIDLINALPKNFKIYLLGGGGHDIDLCRNIMNGISNENCINLCGQLSMLQSVALISTAMMNYVNDSAPLHFCSSVNAPVTSIFCSTIPEFGFGPLSDNQHIIETKESLSCRPCGLHGKKSCPEIHFKCGYNINTKNLLEWITA